MKILLDDAWMLGAILSFAVLAFGAWLAFMGSDFVLDLLGKGPSLTDLSAQILGKASNPEAMDLSC